MNTIKPFINAAIQVVLLFAASIAVSFVTDYLQLSGFFGDTKLEKENVYAFMDKGWNWGTRHYLWHCMCISLFIISVARIVHSTTEENDKNQNIV
jgi:hypothetical protein